MVMTALKGMMRHKETIQRTEQIVRIVQLDMRLRRRMEKMDAAGSMVLKVQTVMTALITELLVKMEWTETRALTEQMELMALMVRMEKMKVDGVAGADGGDGRDGDGGADGDDGAECRDAIFPPYSRAKYWLSRATFQFRLTSTSRPSAGRMWRRS